RMRRLILLLLCLSAVLAAMQEAARTQPLADFYRGRQVRLLIGANPGGAYDAHGRLLAAHLGRHIPSKPAIVVSNSPAPPACSRLLPFCRLRPRAARFLGLFNQSMAQRRMQEVEAVHVDAVVSTARCDGYDEQCLHP